MTAPSLAVLLALAAAASVSASAQPVPAGASPDSTPTLRSLATPLGLLIGAAVAVGPLQSDPAYAQTLGRQFNAVTPENAMKFMAVHPRPGSDPGSYDFSQADGIVSFAANHGMNVRGHTLVWHNALPPWLTSGAYSPDDMKAILQNHIQTTVGHFKGKLYSWDVVNEAVAPDGTLRQTPWSAIGPDYVADAFRWARAADPDAKLFYNDYGAESSPAKADGIYNLVKSLKDAGVPIDGVGLQMHLSLSQSYGDFAALLGRFGSLGVEVHVTEMDVMAGSPETPENLAAQAAMYGRVMSACLAQPSCKGFVLWGFTDKYSWRAANSPLIFDASEQPKPAFTALEQALSGAAK
jgi:endo-1,4-beta-xylanase